MKKIIYIIIIMSLLLLTACEELTSSKRYTSDRYVVSGLLLANKTVSMENPIVVCKTVEVDGGNVMDFFVTDAIVVLTDVQNQVEYPLTFDSDLMNKKFGYHDPSNSLIIKAGNEYMLSVKTVSDSIWATTTVPDSISVVPNPGYSFVNQLPYPQMVYSNIDRDNKIKFQTFSSNNINLFVEYYCLEEWQDAEYTLTFGSSEEYPKDQESYENELNGSPRRGFGYYQYKPVAEDGGYFVEIGFNQLSYTFYGRYRTTVYSIDDNYYSYLYKYEGYKYGGVHNGYGYFGSANGQQMWSKVVK